MPVNVQRRELDWSIGLEGPMTITAAADVKNALMEWMAAERDLELDLERTEEIDVTIMQLLWAAAREGANRGAKVYGRASRSAARDLRDAGFSETPGFPVFQITDDTVDHPGDGNG